MVTYREGRNVFKGAEKEDGFFGYTLFYRFDFKTV